MVKCLLQKTETRTKKKFCKISFFYRFLFDLLGITDKYPPFLFAWLPTGLNGYYRERTV